MELTVAIQKRLPGFTLNVNFTAGSEVSGLLGASGAGKSMTLRCIAGIEKPDAGRIVLNDRVLFDAEKGINLPPRQRKVGFLFQNYALFPNMTVEENIGFGLEALSREDRSQVVHRMIQMIKLEGLEKRYPAQLSGGQQQRAALARALVVEPEALLLDEPFSALDDHLRSHMVKQLIDTIAAYPGVTLFVTHNIEESYRICKRLIVLNNGQVDALGSKEDVFAKPPSLETARITGCKNFSEVGSHSPGEVEAVDWGVTLKINHEPARAVRHVGIRAHYIRRALDTDQDNVFNGWPCFVNESPFRMTVYLCLGRQPLGPQDYHLQWEMPKEKWLELKNQPLPWPVYLHPDDLILLES